MDDFDEFYRDEYGSVLRTVRLALGDAGRAEEVTQEAFARALRRWRVVREMARPGGWVVVVAINADRKRWKSEPAPVDLESASDVEDHAGSVATSVTLHAALQQLTVRQRSAVVMRYLSDLTIADVAAALGCAEGTAKATINQALRRLRVDLEEDAP